jgi:hypothetical protein
LIPETKTLLNQLILIAVQLCYSDLNFSSKLTATEEPVTILYMCTNAFDLQLTLVNAYQQHQTKSCLPLIEMT